MRALNNSKTTTTSHYSDHDITKTTNTGNRV